MSAHLRVIEGGRLLAANADPFRSVEEAWFWTMAALIARREGRSAEGPKRVALWEPDDVARALDRLYRQRRITLAHAKVLRVWGEKGVAPRRSLGAEANDARLWAEAMAALGTPLRMRGIVR